MRFLLVAAAAALGLGGCALALRLAMSRAAEDRLRAGEEVAIADLRPPLPANGFLVCPPGYCRIAEAGSSPVLALPLPRLRQCWDRMIADESLVATVSAEATRAVYIQHTPLLRFPDIVTVEFVALGDDRSALAIYSRARYGRSDFGTNRRRVERWLARLAAVAAAC